MSTLVAMTVKDELIALQGVYGRECTQARESAKAEFCLLGIVNGKLARAGSSVGRRRSGLSCLRRIYPVAVRVRDSALANHRRQAHGVDGVQR
jgi:hypothetical protein